MQNISSPPAAYAEVQINENMAALGQAFCFAHNVPATSGLVLGINGGTLNGNTVANSTVNCTAAATNYIVAHRTTRVASSATTTTNWDNTSTYGRVARAVFAAGLLTTFHDERNSVGGIFDHSAPLASGQPYDVIVFLPGLQTAATQKLYRGKVARAVSFAANFAGSYFAASANATASTVFDVQKNGVSIGTVTIAAGGTTATFATSGGAAQALVAGDLLAVLGPATADATLADPSFTLVGTR